MALAAFSLAACRRQAVAPADLVLKNGSVYTVDNALPRATAIAIRDGKFIYVGDDAGGAKFIGHGTQVLDLGGKLVLPGFVESHGHAISAYKQFFEINLNDCQNAGDYGKVIREYALAHPGAKFIRGRGWSNTLFGKTGPDRKTIDDIVRGIPVCLASEDGHSKWVNSRALELAGITKATPDPVNGVIERDPRTGEPTGTLRESAAALVAGLFPEPGKEELKKGLEAFQRMALAFGITTVHDAYLDAESIETDAYRELENAGRLQARFRASLYVDPLKGTGQLAAIEHERLRNRGPLFQTNAVKLFADGVVEGSTAYLLEPYQHLPRSRGTLRWESGALAGMCAELDRRKFQVHVHAIGDAAVRAFLDAFAHAEKVNGRRDSRNMITHLQLVAPADIPRFKALGVIAVPQPYWFMKDDYYTNLQVPYLGQERADLEYPMASFFRAGVVVASASDYPVTIPCNPLKAIQVGMTRSEPGKTAPGDVLWPEERATLEQMIASFTINGAYANFLEDSTGSISVGKSADLIVLDRDLFKIPATEIAGAKVLLTLFEGKAAFTDPSFPSSGPPAER